MLHLCFIHTSFMLCSCFKVGINSVHLLSVSLIPVKKHSGTGKTPFCGVKVFYRFVEGNPLKTET